MAHNPTNTQEIFFLLSIVTFEYPRVCRYSAFMKCHRYIPITTRKDVAEKFPIISVNVQLHIKYIDIQHIKGTVMPCLKEEKN